MRRADGTWVNNNRAHYTAYGSYMIKPGANVNPGISDRGYTGHRRAMSSSPTPAPTTSA
jgi:hypothetical protein